MNSVPEVPLGLVVAAISSSPPAALVVAWWEVWMSLALPTYHFLSSFILAAISSPHPPETPEVA